MAISNAAIAQLIRMTRFPTVLYSGLSAFSAKSINSLELPSPHTLTRSENRIARICLLRGLSVLVRKVVVAVSFAKV